MAAGQVSVGQDVVILRRGAPVQRARVTALEAFRRQLTVAGAGETVGIMFDRSVVLRAGDVLVGAQRPEYAAPGAPPAS